MAFKIEHFSNCGNHITLNSDGSIEIYQSKFLEGMLDQSQKPITIEYQQAKILKAMIIAERELEKL